MSSYTPRRKDSKVELYGGLQLKTRTMDDQAQGPGPERLRRQNFNQQPESYQSQSRGLSKRRESAPYTNPKYPYEGRFDEEDPKRTEDNIMREIRQRDNREQRQARGDQREQYKEAREPRELDRPIQEKPSEQEFKRGSYLGIKRNEAIMKESRKDWGAQESKKENQVPKKMDPQLAEKLYSISKLSSRISERLKNMSMALEKHRV